LPLGSLALSMQSWLGSVPASVGTQVPTLPGRLQLPHERQSRSQHTPLVSPGTIEQWFDWHWLSRVQL